MLRDLASMFWSMKWSALAVIASAAWLGVDRNRAEARFRKDYETATGCEVREHPVRDCTAIPRTWHDTLWLCCEESP